MSTQSLPQRLALSAAITTALFSGYGGRKAYAASLDCTTGTPGTYTCSGTQTTTQNISSDNASVITITTSPGFSVNTADFDGFNIDTGAATLGLTFTDNNSSAITGDDDGIEARNDGTGALSITSTGTVTGINADGIDARNYGTNLTINTAGVTGVRNGIYAYNYASGTLSITSTGAVTGTNFEGISALNYGTDLTINAASVTGGQFGISANNYGDGALSITSTGAVTGGINYAGIYATNTNTNSTDLTINAASVTGGYGVAATNRGTGGLSITTTGAVTGTSFIGISANNRNGTDLTINAASVTGGYGVTATNDGSGALSITTTGAVTGTNFTGIFARNYGDNLTVNAASVSGGVSGISAGNYSGGTLSITATGTVTGTNYVGIGANNYGTDLVINAASVTGGGFGIRARNYGSDALSITTTGAVTGTTYDGIRADNSADGTNLTINTASVSGGDYGINAINEGSGSLSVTSTGTVTGTNQYGIYAFSDNVASTDVTVNAVDVTGGSYGIGAWSTGTGALSITSTGTVTGNTRDGIYTYNNGTNLTVDAASVAGAYRGIRATNNGSGALSIATSGIVTGTNNEGILARNYGTDLTINAATVSGGYNGIFASNSGSGALSITTSGTVTGGASGIIAGHYGNGALSITASGAVTGTSAAGIAAFNFGPGNTYISVSGVVTGGNYHGFYLAGLGAASLTLNAGAAVSANSGVAIFDTGPQATTVTVNSGASVIGDIILGDGDDTLIFDGGDFSQVTLFDGDDFANDGGTGGNFDSLTLSGSGQIDPTLLVNWEEINLAGSLSFAGSTFTFDDLTIGSDGILDGGSGFTFTGDLTIGSGGTLDAGSAFQIIGDLFLNAGGTLDSTGNSPSNTVITGNFTNAGLITMADNETNDTVTITGNYTSAGGTLELDAQLNDGVIDITDTLTINGSSAGATAVTVNNVGGTGGDTDTGNPTTDGIQIIQIDGVSNGTFTLANSVSAGAFTYDLVQADGQNWFLQSTGLIDQLFGYSALASAIHDQLEPLRQRDHRGQLVNLDGQISTTGSGFWSRVSYSETEADASNSVGTIKVDSEVEYERSKLQVGYDRTLRADNQGTLIGSVFGQYQDLDLETDDAITGAKQADAQAEGWGVGASVTYYATSGWYGDAMVQVTDYDIEVDGASGSEADTDALNWSVSVEGGYAFDLGNDLTITPQVQLLWQQTDFDKVTDSDGVTAKWAQRDSLTARAGVTLERDFMVGESPITGYVVTDVVQVISDASDVEVNGVNVKTQLNRTRLDLRVGGQHISADKQLVIYAELGASEALNSKDYQRIDATAGLRWRY